MTEAKNETFNNICLCTDEAPIVKTAEATKKAFHEEFQEALLKRFNADVELEETGEYCDREFVVTIQGEWDENGDVVIYFMFGPSNSDTSD